MISRLKRQWKRLQSGSAGWALGDQAIASGVTFLTGLLIARLVGPEQFGVFGLLMMVVLFFNSIQYALIVSPMLSIGPQLPEQDQRAFYAAQGCAALLLIIVSTLLTLAGSSVLAAVEPKWRIDGYLMALTAAVACVQLHEFYRRYFFASGEPKRAGASSMWRYSLQGIGLVVLFVSEVTDLNVLFWLVAASALIGGGLAHRHDRLVGFHFEALRRFRERTWITGRWIFGSTILQWLTGNYFAVVAGVVIGPIAVGALRAVQQLLAPIQIVTLAATNVIPVIAAEKLKSGGVREMNWFLLKVSVSGGIVTAVIGVILTLGGDFWLVFLFGSKFSGYGYLIPWLSAALLLFYWELPLQAGLRALEDTRALFYGYVFAAICSLISAHWLIQAWGIEGAAVGIMLSHVIFAASQLFGLHKACKNRVEGLTEATRCVASHSEAAVKADPTNAD